MTIGDGIAAAAVAWMFARMMWIVSRHQLRLSELAFEARKQGFRAEIK